MPAGWGRDVIEVDETHDVTELMDGAQTATRNQRCSASAHSRAISRTCWWLAASNMFVVVDARGVLALFNQRGVVVQADDIAESSSKLMCQSSSKATSDPLSKPFNTRP